MYKLKYPKKKKNQLDQKIREREKESKAHLTRNTSLKLTSSEIPHQRGLGLRGLGFVWPGSCMAWACAAWVARDLGCVRPRWKKPKQRTAQVTHDLSHALPWFLCYGFFWFFFLLLLLLLLLLWVFSDSLIMFYIYKGSKSSLRDSIFMWSPRGKICHIGP